MQRPGPRPWRLPEWVLAHHHGHELAPADRAELAAAWATFQRPGKAAAFAKSVLASLKQTN